MRSYAALISRARSSARRFSSSGTSPSLSGMVLAHQFAVGTFDVAFAGAAIKAKHGIRIDANRSRRRRARPGAARSALRRRAVALHRRERGELVIADAERAAEFAHERELGFGERTFGVHEIEQQIEHEKRKVAPPAAPGLEIGDRELRLEIRLLPEIEALDRRAALCAVEAQTAPSAIPRRRSRLPKRAHPIWRAHRLMANSGSMKPRPIDGGLSCAAATS